MSTISMPIKTLGALHAPSWHRPWLRYADAVDGAEGGTGEGEDLGFPKDTPTDQMTPEQQVAYWKNQSKVQQRARDAAEKGVKAYEKFGTPEDLQALADAAEQARLAGLDEQQRAIEQARTEGKAEGAREAGTAYLADAVKGMLIAHTKGATETFEQASERISGAIEFADLTKFIGENGVLDAEKVQTFASSIGSTDSGGTGAQSFPLFESMQRQSLPAPGSAGSVAQMEQAAYERLKSK